jgi:uncharacterized protein (DUF488 family)
MRIFSIGHSTRTLDELVSLLHGHAIKRLADIRRYPGSRRYPHFSRESLAAELPKRGVEYLHLPELGGRRKPAPDSPNDFWRNDQFRAYADHMATEEFRAAVERLVASDKVTAYMCAEAVPWRCHRNLLSDELVRRGIAVFHVIGSGSVQPHELNPNARVDGDHLIYPLDAQQRLV